MLTEIEGGEKGILEDYGYLESMLLQGLMERTTAN